MNLIARRFDTGECVQIELAGRNIASITLFSLSAGEAASLPWIAPGFVDLQVNGYAGQEFCSPSLTIEAVEKIIESHLTFGVTRLCPTITTHSYEHILHAMQTLSRACDQEYGLAARVLGIHLEGPYISREDGARGAHPLAHCRPPDWKEFCDWQDAAEGRIRLVTLSPEYPEAIAFIQQATASGVVISIGHTAANSEQIQAAVEAGARCSTHLGNGAHRTLPRHPNYIWDQLAEDRLVACLIADGHHLPRSVLKVILRAKGPERCVIVSDVSGLAGMPVGKHAAMGGELEILEDGRLVVAGQTQLLAGASRPIGAGIVNLVCKLGLPLPLAVAMATTQPARLVGAWEGQLEPHALADLVLFDLPTSAEDIAAARLHIRQTYAAGLCVYDASKGVTL